MRRLQLISWIGLPAALAVVLGCSQVHAPGKASSTAPTLGEGAEPHIRGVSDPNAPFTLIDRSHATARQPSTQVAATASGCDPLSLQVYEAAASMNGAERSLRLAVKNQGAAACRLSGSPSISLEDDNGAAIASIAVRQTGTSSLGGMVEPPIRDVAAVSPGAQSVEIVLSPSGEASFEIGWSSGDNCPLVSRIAIGVAGASDVGLTNRFSINHPLRVCNGEVRISSLLSGSSV